MVKWDFTIRLIIKKGFFMDYYLSKVKDSVIDTALFGGCCLAVAGLTVSAAMATFLTTVAVVDAAFKSLQMEHGLYKINDEQSFNIGTAVVLFTASGVLFWGMQRCVNRTIKAREDVKQKSDPDSHKTAGGSSSPQQGQSSHGGAIGNGEGDESFASLLGIPDPDEDVDDVSDPYQPSNSGTRPSVPSERVRRITTGGNNPHRIKND